MDDEQDIFQELLSLFEQVSVERWYPRIKDHTFRTVECPLTKEEAQVLLTANRLARKQIQPSSSTTLETDVLDKLRSRLAQLIEEEFGHKGEEGRRPSSVFVKLSDRSPKDAVAVLEDKVCRLYQERLKETQQLSSNSHLQAYVWAKCHSLRVESADEALTLLTNSERVATELEMKLEQTTATSSSPSGLSIVLREFWDNFDPAYEFRGFVCNDKLAALSQMATMDVTLHYPQLIEERDFLGRRAQEFFEAQMRELLRAITAHGPSNKYVLDLYYDKKLDRFYVVEVNPFQTSSSGHLFQYWQPIDAKVLEGRAPFEFRLRDSTPLDALVDVPLSWREKLTQTTDLYGLTETQWLFTAS